MLSATTPLEVVMKYTHGSWWYLTWYLKWYLESHNSESVGMVWGEKGSDTIFVLWTPVDT